MSTGMIKMSINRRERIWETWAESNPHILMMTKIMGVKALKWHRIVIKFQAQRSKGIAVILIEFFSLTERTSFGGKGSSLILKSKV